jgi:hypothetical protein
VLAGFALTGLEYQTADGRFKTFCLIKNISGYPCPSCGTTRAASHLLHGNMQQAALTNPLVFVSLPLATGALLLLLSDLFSGRKDFERALERFNKFFYNKTWLWLILILFILINWSWNVQKGL